MHILFIASNYPKPETPTSGTFVRQLVREIALKGIKCSVISPVNSNRHNNRPIKFYDDYNKKNPISIISPKYTSLSNKNILNFNTYNLTIKNYYKSVLKALKFLDSKPTIVYGHFLYSGGYASVKVGKKLNIPSIVAVGESGTFIERSVKKSIGIKKSIQNFKNVSGIITVSKQNTNYSKDLLKIPSEKIKELPNGIDTKLFKSHDRNKMREKYNFPKDKTIIAFTGHFIERKGPHRLLKAIEGMEDVKVILIGSGPIKLESPQILFKDTVEHEKIPEYLSASDMFVLPTLAEGSCNAIIEAIGCGLPVVSSKNDFNDGILNEENSIRVDPMDTEEIRNAVAYLQKNKEIRENMVLNALNHSKQFEITDRAEKVLDWIREVEKAYWT